MLAVRRAALSSTRQNRNRPRCIRRQSCAIAASCVLRSETHTRGPNAERSVLAASARYTSVTNTCRSRNGAKRQCSAYMNKPAIIIPGLIPGLIAALIAGVGFTTTAEQGNQFVQTVLVANKPSFHPQIVDPEVINPW